MTLRGVHRETLNREPPKHTSRRVPMDEYERLGHTRGECKYGVVFILKYPRQALYGQLKRYLGEMFRKPPGAGGPAPGVVESMALTGHRTGGPGVRGRVSEPV